jgi:putative membrane protein
MMKSLLASVACAALLSACNQQGASPAVDKAQDAAAAPVGQMSAATMGSNMLSAYVPNAAMGDMYEIQAADIALERSGNAKVKELAQMIKTDHTMASNEFKGLVPTAAPGETLPTSLDQRRQGLIDNLRSASAADFDKVYIDQQIAAHNEAITLHQGFADNTDHPQLAAFSTKVLPKIRGHLEMAEQIKATM